MTPVQFVLFTNMGIPADIAIKLAFGTSLLVALPASASGAWRHSRKKAVFWKAAIVMGSCSMAAAFGGASLSSHLPGDILKIAFGVLVLAGGVRMLAGGLPESEEEVKYAPWRWAGWAVLVGFISGMVGAGGGILAIPIMVLALKFKIHKAIATSSAMVVFTSAGGVIGYIINGLNVSGLPEYSLGYVHLPSWFLLAVTSIGMAQVGAATAHRLSGKWLRYIFIVVMFYLGLKMIGVFDWLSLPL